MVSFDKIPQGLFPTKTTIPLDNNKAQAPGEGKDGQVLREQMRDMCLLGSVETRLVAKESINLQFFLLAFEVASGLVHY